jgi:Putative MetA-pathway of phenol degradation
VRGHLILLALVAFGLGSAVSAADEQQPICADRPSKSTGECTVPAGHWQIETGLADWTHDSAGGITTDLTTIGSSLLKLGISGDADVELGFTPYEISRIGAGGAHERDAGFGDMFVRVKYRVTRDDAPVVVALDPFLKAPTAGHDLGNGKAEGGLLVPMSAQLGGILTVAVDPELDLLADDNGHGYHLATVQVVNVGAAVSDKLSVSAELWGQWNWEPRGTARQASADAAAAYLLSNDVQLDAGANFGLNRNTSDIELYTGVSMRF